jgi:hypothetical protein
MWGASPAAQLWSCFELSDACAARYMLTRNDVSLHHPHIRHSHPIPPATYELGGAVPLRPVFAFAFPGSVAERSLTDEKPPVCVADTDVICGF